MIETARDFTRQFNMRHLIHAYRHTVGAVDQNISRLQQRITEEVVCAKNLFAQLVA